MSTAANNNHLETGHEELFSTSVNRAYLFSKLLDERAPENCFDSKADIQSFYGAKARAHVAQQMLTAASTP